MKTVLQIPVNFFIPLLIGVALTACNNVQQPPMRIGMNIWPGYEPLFLARHIGSLNEEEFRLVEFSNASEVGRAFRNGTLEAACLTLDEVFYTMQDGMDPVILLVMDESCGADVVLSHPEIKDLTGLRGKKIAVEVSAVGVYMLTRALQQANLTTKDVIPVYLPIDKHLAAYEDKLVDAVVTFDPVRTRLMAQGAVDLFNSSRIPGEIVDVFVVRRDYLEKHPDQGVKLHRGWFAALKHMQQSPFEAAKFMAIREHMSTEEFKHSLGGLHIPDEQESKMLLGTPVPKLFETAKKLNTVMHESGLLNRDISLKPLFILPEEMKVGQ